MTAMMLDKPDYKGRPDFNVSWSNMTRKVHLLNLSKPHPRRLRPYPDPMYYQQVPPSVTKESLSYKPSNRIKLLSAPLESRSSRKFTAAPPYDHFVEPSALMFTPSKRLNYLAKPKALSKEKKKPPLRKREMQREKEKLKQSLDKREEWMARCAAPKKYPLPERKGSPRSRFVFHGTRKVKIPERKFIPKYERYLLSKPSSPLKVTKEELMRRMAVLAIPTRKREKYIDVMARKMQEHPKPIPQASVRIQELALPRQLPPEALLDLKYKPYKISKNAMRYQATDRVNALAVPITKTKKVDNDVKENPFGVSKAALNAVCSKRIAELAKPIIKD